jgi:uridine monophosphate synthetase
MTQYIIDSLFKTDCIKTGKFILKNGDVSKYYFDLKNIISTPSLLCDIGDLIYSNIDTDFDIICGIPYGGLPIASYISTRYNKPMIILRSTKKDYGMQKLIEGNYNNNSRCVLIDDVITSGKSIQEAYDVLNDELNVVQSIVVFNRQQNYKCSFDIKCLLHKNDVIKYKLNHLINNNKRLIFAADIIDPIDLLNTIEKIGSYIGICKIHSDIIDYNILSFDNFKKELIDLSIKYDFLIMEDRKFVDISSVVESQYNKFCNWVDLITVHASVTSETISKLSGALIVANMSNNIYDYSKKALLLANRNTNNVIGFISQYKLDKRFYTMTPGISFTENKKDDQNYRSIDQVNTDFYIVGRTLYNSNNIVQDAEILSSIINDKH